jgi:ATP-dependent Clp protease, protease subunit
MRPELFGSPDFLEREMFARRVVFLTVQLDATLAMRTAAELMTLDAAGADPIDVHVGCPDGTLEAALSIMDTLDLLQAPTRGHALGEVGGPAIGIVAVCRQRTAAPHAGFHLAEPKAQFAGPSEQIVAAAEQHRRLLDRFRSRLARATGQSEAEIAAALQQGRYLSAQEAVDFGLIDAIAARPGIRP